MRIEGTDGVRVRGGGVILHSEEEEEEEETHLPLLVCSNRNKPSGLGPG